MSEDFKDITLRVKVDTYKAISNYIHSEMKVTKEDIEKVVENKVASIIEKYMNNGWLVDIADKIIKNELRGKTGWTTSLDKAIQNEIEKEIGKKLRQEVEDKIKLYEILDLVKRKTTTE